MKRSLVHDLSIDDLNTLQKRVLIEGMILEMSALVDKLGPDGALEAVRPYVRMSARAFVINMGDLLRKEVSDIDRIAEITDIWQVLTGSATEVQEVSTGGDKIIRVGFYNCPYKSGPKELCLWGHEMMINEMCESINPEYECHFTQMMTKGDPICSYIIEKK